MSEKERGGKLDTKERDGSSRR